MHHPQRRNVTTSMVGLKKATTTTTTTNTKQNKNPVTYAKISPEMVNPRDIDGNAGKEEEEEAGTVVSVSAPLALPGRV